MQKTRAVHPIVVATMTLVLSVPAGCDPSTLRTGSNQASDGAAGMVAADAGFPSAGGIAGGGTGPVGTGGSTGVVGVGGAGGEGRDSSIGTGGATSANGGATSAPIDAGTVPPGPATVQLAQTRQDIAGFGINLSWAPGMSDADADALFDPTKGLGLTIVRVSMSSSGGFVSNNIAQDIAKAKARGVQHVIGTLASPPAKCKDNNKEEGGGHLLASCYESWSDVIVKFASEQGLYGMSPQNEPDFASCGTGEPCTGDYPTTLYTADEMVAFIKVVGPKLRAAGIKVIAPEPSGWLRLWSNQSACCSEPSMMPSPDPLGCGSPPTLCAPGQGYDYGHFLYQDKDAWQVLDIIGVHQYDTHEVVPWPADVPTGKPLWQTEAGGVKWWPEHGPSRDISNGVAVARWIHDALTIGDASAWLWFWYKDGGSNDNLGLLLAGGTDTKRRYALGNYSRFIRPGYLRVDITGAVPEDVLLSAFTGGDGIVVVVAINKGSATTTMPITIAGGAAPASLVPWVTSASDDLVAKTPVPVTSGSFIASLASMTVTTFVGMASAVR